jgi:hypothetical protein
MKILRRLPFSDSPATVTTPDGIAGVKPYQILTWVSVAARKHTEMPAGLPRFPAILDTGMNHNFSIRREHYENWTRRVLRQRGRVRIGGEEVPLFAGSVWIHPNRSGTTQPSDAPAFRLDLPDGIIVYPKDVPNPARLPVLGLRALVRSRLKLVIDGERQEVTLKTPGWF